MFLESWDHEDGGSLQTFSFSAQAPTFLYMKSLIHTDADININKDTDGINLIDEILV